MDGMVAGCWIAVNRQHPGQGMPTFPDIIDWWG
jgi:hypothetical protein